MNRTLLRAALLAAVLAAGGAVNAELGDIAFKRKSVGADDVPPAMFPHFVHRIQFRCYVCHNDIVAMRAGANPITMDAIQDGKFCGVCHNGKVAFQATFDTCPRCHRP